MIDSDEEAHHSEFRPAEVAPPPPHPTMAGEWPEDAVCPFHSPPPRLSELPTAAAVLEWS